MIYLLALAYALWAGVVWRLRGGALTAMTGYDPGTGGMRAIAAGLMGVPLAALAGSWLCIGLVVTLWVGWAIAGWGGFQGMNGPQPPKAESWLDMTLTRTGLPWLAVDIIGMALSGVVCMAPSAPLLAVVAGWPVGAALALSGAVMAPCYLVAQRGPWRPGCGSFAMAGSEWGEVLSGFCIGLALALAVVL